MQTRLQFTVAGKRNEQISSPVPSPYEGDLNEGRLSPRLGIQPLFGEEPTLHGLIPEQRLATEPNFYPDFRSPSHHLDISSGSRALSTSKFAQLIRFISGVFPLFNFLSSLYIIYRAITKNIRQSTYSKSTMRGDPRE